ncbi:MAG: DUF983 domain-containing protein [Methyloligellaceae bacterium]
MRQFDENENKVFRNVPGSPIFQIMSDSTTYENSRNAPLNRPPRAFGSALLRGMRLRCPNCSIGHLFSNYLKVQDSCAHCGEELHHHRADDAPPYVTIFIVGHIVVSLVLAVEVAFQPSYLIHALLWFPLSLLLSLIFLPISKGAIVGWQWALYMHGFGGTEDSADPIPIGE